MPTSIGARIQEARKAVRLSQTAVGKELGTTRQTISAYERGTRQPSAEELPRLANLFRRPPSWFFADGFQGQPLQKTTRRFLGRADLNHELEGFDATELADFEETLQSHADWEPDLEYQAPREGLSFPRLAADAFSRYGLERVRPPVDIYGMILKARIYLRFTNLDGLSGAYFPHDVVGEGSAAGIVVNSSQPFDRQRFNAAHEFAHFILRHHIAAPHTSKMGRRYSGDELDADRLAAELLMPTALVQKAWEQPKSAELVARVASLAAMFAVSIHALIVKLSQLGLISSNQQKMLLDLPAADIKQEAKGAVGELRIDFELLEEHAPLPPGWQLDPDPDWTRAFQEFVCIECLRANPAHQGACSSGEIYELAALWLARKYPLYKVESAPRLRRVK